MLLCDIGAVYLRFSLVLKANSESIKLITINQSDFQFILDKPTISFNNETMIFFKLNTIKSDIFFQSIDFKVIRQILELEKITKCFYCGYFRSELEKLIKDNFITEFIKTGHTNQLSVYGLETISNIDNAFYELPHEKITNLVKVGHKLDNVSEKIYLKITNKEFFPILFANIIEGASIYKADDKDNFTRVGGTTFGATTYWNLVSMACGYDDPEEAVRDAIKGNNELIDLAVGDIYGGSYDQFSLESQLIASSFGKLKYVEDMTKVERQDISRSLMTLLCVIVSQICAMIAVNEQLRNIIILGNPFECLEFMQMIQMGTNYFSKNQVKALFTDYSPFINLIGMYKYLEKQQNN